MSELDDLFKLAMKANQKKLQKFTLIHGTVKAVEGDTCTVGDYEDVKLNAIVDDLESQFTIYPKVGSEVIIGRLAKEDDMFVIRVSEIDKVTIKIGSHLFEMKDGKFSIKTGSVNLKSILNDAFSQLKNAVILTPSMPPGSFSPADIAVFEQLNEKVNQLLI